VGAAAAAAARSDSIEKGTSNGGRNRMSSCNARAFLIEVTRFDERRLPSFALSSGTTGAPASGEEAEVEGAGWAPVWLSPSVMLCTLSYGE